MSKIFSFLLLFSVYSYSIGQQESKLYISVYGKIQDADTKEPLEFATVSIHQLSDDKLINGTLVSKNGEFLIDGLKPGKYKFKVSFMGYNTYFQEINLSPPNFQVDLGNIKIQKDLKQLALVEVSDEKPSITMNLDRKVFNVDKDITSAGGTAQDVLANVPGVLVDNEGNVTVRSTSPMIFIDGRPSLLELEQIPAEDIDRIEVITNPSAQFDAGATGGIINIILKKNLKPGYNGMLAAGWGTNGRANAMISLNLRTNKWSFSFSNSYRYVDILSTAFTSRETIVDNLVEKFRQDSDNRRNRQFHFGRFGIEYKINNRTTINLNQNYNIGSMLMSDGQKYFFSQNNLQPYSRGFQHNEMESTYLRYSAQLQLVRQTPKEGREWMADITYNRATRDSRSQFDIEDFDQNGQFQIIGPELHDGKESSHLIRFQADYTDKLSNGAKIDIGVNSNTRLNSSFLNVNRFDNFTEQFNRDSLLSNQFEITELINAAYFQYGNTVGSNSFSGGLRFEQTYFIGKLTDKDLSFEYIYPRGTENLLKALFPTLYYSKKIDSKNEVQINFARKIGRPDFFQSMPFIFFSDRQNYRVGNPNLAPEFNNQAELNYNRNLKSGSILITGFGKINEDIITQYVFRSDEDSSVLINSFINGNTSYNAGLEMNLGLKITKKLSFNLNLNGQYNIINATIDGIDLSNRGYNGFAKLMMQYKQNDKLSFQLNGNYESPEIIPQGRTISRYFIDLSLRKDFGNRWSMNLSANDLLNSKRWGTVIDTPGLRQTTSRRWDVRNYRINLTYKFGESDPAIFRKRSLRKIENGGGGGDEGF